MALDDGLAGIDCYATSQELLQSTRDYKGAMQSPTFRRIYDLLLDSDFSKSYTRTSLTKPHDYTFVTDAVRLHDSLGEYTPQLYDMPATSSRAKNAYVLALRLLVARPYTHWKDVPQWSVDIRRCTDEARRHVHIPSAERAFIRMRAPAFEPQLSFDKKMLQTHALLFYDIGTSPSRAPSVQNSYRRIKADGLKLTRARRMLDTLAGMIDDTSTDQVMRDYSSLRSMLRASEDFNTAEEAFFIALHCRRTRAHRILTLAGSLHDIQREKLPPRLRHYYDFLSQIA